MALSKTLLVASLMSQGMLVNCLSVHSVLGKFTELQATAQGGNLTQCICVCRGAARQCAGSGIGDGTQASPPYREDALQKGATRLSCAMCESLAACQLYELLEHCL